LGYASISEHSTSTLPLLPEYRGAAPQTGQLSMESKTGVTTFFIDDKIDTEQ
jgi:methionyl-tRNA formyltransferase